MPKSVEITSDGMEPPSWLPDSTAIVHSACAAAGLLQWDVSILLCEDDQMSALNREYRKVEGTTDVLTFSQNDGAALPGLDESVCAGDIAVSIPCVERNALENRVDLVEEFIRVLVHGVLHLAGYDHDGVDMSSPAIGSHPMLSLQERLVLASMEEYRR